MNEYAQINGPRFEIDINSQEYPPILKDSPEAPEVLYGIGNPDALQPGIAIIGAPKTIPKSLKSTIQVIQYSLEWLQSHF